MLQRYKKIRLPTLCWKEDGFGHWLELQRPLLSRVGYSISCFSLD